MAGTVSFSLNDISSSWFKWLEIAQNRLLSAKQMMKNYICRSYGELSTQI